MTTVTRLDAARRQLDQAISLFCSEGDAVSIHSLTLNAFEIVSVLARTNGKTDWLELVRQDAAEVHGLSTKQAFFEVFNRARNFFKHSGRDASAALEFSDTDNDAALTLAVLQYIQVAPMSSKMLGFLIWFYATNPRFPIPELLAAEVEPYRGNERQARSVLLEMGRDIQDDIASRLRPAPR